MLCGDSLVRQGKEISALALENGTQDENDDASENEGNRTIEHFKCPREVLDKNGNTQPEDSEINDAGHAQYGAVPDDREQEDECEQDMDNVQARNEERHFGRVAAVVIAGDRLIGEAKQIRHVCECVDKADVERQHQKTHTPLVCAKTSEAFSESETEERNDRKGDQNRVLTQLEKRIEELAIRGRDDDGKQEHEQPPMEVGSFR